MDIYSIKKLVSLAKSINLNDIICENIDIGNELKKIISFIQNVFENYSYVLEECNDSDVRFCDYYDASFLHGDDIIKFFEQSYLGEIKKF